MYAIKPTASHTMKDASTHAIEPAEAKRARAIGPCSNHDKRPIARHIVRGKGYEAGGRATVPAPLGISDRPSLHGVHRRIKRPGYGILPLQERRRIQKKSEAAMNRSMFGKGTKHRRRVERGEEKKLKRLKPEESFGEKKLLHDPPARPVGLPVPSSLSNN